MFFHSRFVKNGQKSFQNITVTHSDHEEYFRIIPAVISHQTLWRFCKNCIFRRLFLRKPLIVHRLRKAFPNVFETCSWRYIQNIHLFTETHEADDDCELLKVQRRRCTEGGTTTATLIKTHIISSCFLSFVMNLKIELMTISAVVW